MLPYLIYGLLVITLLTVSFFSIEVWPFSAYPMFSNSSSRSFYSNFFLEMEKSTGEKFKWKPRHPLVRKQIDSHLKSVLLDQNNNLDLLGTNDQPDLLKNMIAHFYQLYQIDNYNDRNLSKVNLFYQQVSKKGKLESPQPVIGFTTKELKQQSNSLS